MDSYNCETCNMSSLAYEYPDFHVAIYPFDEVCHAPFVVWKDSRYYNDCPSCQGYLADGITFFPNHKPSKSCESGSYSHCTCDTCW